MRALQSEIKENSQGTNSEGKETRTQINGLDQNWRNKHSTRTELRNKNSKNEERLRNLQYNFKHSNIQILGVPQGEKEEQETKNLFENIMKETFPNLAKEIDFQEVQEAQRVPKKLDPRKHTQSISQLHYPR